MGGRGIIIPASFYVHSVQGSNIFLKTSVQRRAIRRRRCADADVDGPCS